MASMLKHYQPAPRTWHGAAPIGDRLYMWGGRTEDFGESSKRKLASVVEIYDPSLESWQQEATTGVPPPGLYDGGCTSVHESLLWYGGRDGKSRFGTLHQLNSTTLNWEELHPKSMSHGPMAKTNCGLVLFEGGKVGLFGGYGTPTGPSQPGSTFTKDNRFPDVRGWTNEFHLFDLQEGVWSSPPTTGTRPPPCAVFTFTAIDSNRGVLFGGNSPEHGMMNDVYIINVQTMHWTKLDRSGGGPWPVGRSLHAACCLSYGEEYPQLLVSGGLDEDDNNLRDLWVLDVEAGTWKELALPEGTQPRCGHTTTAFNLSPGVVEVTMFGGSPKYVPREGDQQQHKIAETTVVRLASGGAEWVVKGVTKCSQLGSPERIREKIVKTAVLLSSELAGERENVRKAESKITELEEKMESAETRVRIALARAVGAEIRCDRIPLLEQQLQSTQQLLRTKEEELKALTRATHDTLLHTQEQLSTQRQAHHRLQYTAQQKEEQLQARVRSTQQLLHTKEEELKALTTQYRATQDKLLHTQEQFSTQQQAHSHLQHTAQQKEGQLQARVRENATLHTQRQALTNQVVTLQNQIAQLEQAIQAPQAGALYQAELPVQHSELQKKATGGTELLPPATEDTHAQLKTLQIEIQKLQEELAKETFLETTLADEVDIFREDLMDREEELYRFRTCTQQVHLHGGVEVVDDDYMHTTSGFLRGAEVVAQRDFVISNKAQSHYWEEYGFRLYVPEGSLEAELSECTINVRVSLSGHFQLPADSELVSAVYWVSSPHAFSKPLTVDIEHCAAPSMCSSLSFIRTNCTQKKLPYEFKNLEGGVFSELSSYGSISVRHFSGFGATKKKSARKTRTHKASVTEHKSESENVVYCAQLFVQKRRKLRHFHFVVTKNLEACLTVVKKECIDSGFINCLSFLFEFEDQLFLHLDVPRKGTIIDSEWRLSPLYEPTIKKSQVDHFRSGVLLPKCELLLEWLIRDKPPVGFQHDIELQGAKEHKYFRLFLEETDASSGSESDILHSPDSVQLKESAQQTFDICTPLPPLPTHKHLMNEVAMNISTKWKFFGNELGLQPHQLNAIEKEQNGILALCFSAVFQKWENETTLPYSWSTVITALEAPQVGAVRLARTLKDRLAPVHST